MSQIQEYDLVRVVVLKRADRFFQGSEGVQRPPQVGDIATVCHEYHPGTSDSPVAAEMVTSDGRTVWLADFDRDELELVSRR